METCTQKRAATKRILRLALTMALAIAMLVGCGPSTNNTNPSSDSSKDSVVDNTNTDGMSAKTTLDVGLKAEINGCHPYYNGSPSTAISGLICESLTDRSPEGEVVPYVAKSWKTVDDRTWLFDLEEDISFSNGEKLTAESVVGTFEILQREDITWPLKGDITSVIESMEAVSDYQVKIVTYEPFSTLPLRLVLFRVLPTAYFAEVGDEGYTANPVGSGPYTFVEFEKGDHCTVEAVENHWKYGSPEIKTITFHVILDSAARVAALEAGDLDWIIGVPLNEMERLSQSEKFVTESGPTTFCLFGAFNVYKCEALQDVRVRKAVNMGINIDEIIDVVMGGKATKLNAMTFNPAFDGYDTSIERDPYDPEAARALLVEAGYGDGLTLTLNFTPGSQPNMGEVVQVMAAQLAEIGITLEIEEIESGLLRELYKTQDTADIVIQAIGGWQGDATVVSQLTLEPGQRYSLWSGDEFEKMRIEIESETDTETRAKLYTEMQQLENDICPAITMWQTHETYAYSANLKNWTSYVTTNMVFMDAHFE